MSSARIEDEIWTDPKMRGLTPQELLLFIWLFSNPYRHFSGIYYLPREIIPRQTGLSVREVDRGIDTLIDRGLIQVSIPFEIVFVVKMLGRQTGKAHVLSSTQREGIFRHLQTLHNCPLITEFIKEYSSYGLSFEYTPTDTPMHTPIDTQSKSKSKSNSKSNSKSQSKDKGRKPPLTPLPNNFQISDEVKLWAGKKGFDRLEDYLEAFKEHALSKGWLYVDWDSTFKRFIREDWPKLNSGNTTRHVPSLSKADQVTASNFAAAARVLEKWERKEPN